MAQGSAITTTPTGSGESPRWIRQMDAFTQSSSFRQLLLLIALAAVISFMVGFFLWGSGKSMVPLYQSLDAQSPPRWSRRSRPRASPTSWPPTAR